MEQSFVYWCVIRTSENLCRLHTILVMTYVSIHMFNSDASLFKSPIRTSSSPWSIHLAISVLRYIYNWILGQFLIFIIVRAYSCWLYATPSLELTIGQYAVKVMVLTLFYLCSSIHDERPRFRNYWPITISLHDTLSTAIMDVPPLWIFL